jgi:hypothetical protein
LGGDKAPRQELKAMVEDVRSNADGLPQLRMSHLEVKTDSETEFDGDWSGRRPDPAFVEGVETEAAGSVAPEARALADIEIYDLRSDPGERSNVAEAHREVVQAMMRELDRWEARYGVAARPRAAVELDAETVERLRALGYMN